MSKLFVLKEKDAAPLRIAVSVSRKGEDIGIVMMLDAVYMASLNGENAEAMRDCLESGVRVHVLKKDAERRGLIGRMFDGTETVDYSGLVDLFFSEEQTVINL